MDVSKLTIGALTTSFSKTPARATSLPDPPISPKMPARLTTLELRDEYRRTGRCVRCGYKDHWIKNCSLAPHNALASTPYRTGKNGLIASSDDGSDRSDYEYTEAEVDAMVAERPDIN
jgi:hypothetical protein